MKVLIVDDERNIRETLKRLLDLDGFQAELASDGKEALQRLKSEPFEAVLTDLRMPLMGGQELLELARDEGIRCPIIMMSAFGEIKDAVKALKAGADDYLIKPFEPDELVHKLRSVILKKRQEDRLEANARTEPAISRLLGEGPAAQALRHDIEKIASVDTTVLISGESGSGKEVVAREIHRSSSRAEEPFIAVNIGGIHENLMESELFGHEKGSFTGADARKVGLFELAGSGSLFLDEIGEMPQRLQVKLLRVLQERTIRRLGGTRDIPVSARIFSATNRNVEEQVRSGEFREDLYYRLNVLRVDVPPLRARREDIPLLADALLERLRVRMGKGAMRLSDKAKVALAGYDYPGNVRELENILERALIYAEGEQINTGDLDLVGGFAVQKASPANGSDEAGDAVPASLDGMERDAIERALSAWSGNRTKAAEELGISRRTILYKIKRYGLN